MLATGASLDAGLEDNGSRSGDLLLPLELTVLLSWTDGLFPLADRPERPLGVVTAAGSLPARDEDAERPRDDAGSLGVFCASTSKVSSSCAGSRVTEPCCECEAFGPTFEDGIACNV